MKKEIQNSTLDLLLQIILDSKQKYLSISFLDKIIIWDRDIFSIKDYTDLLVEKRYLIWSVKANAFEVIISDNQLLLLNQLKNLPIKSRQEIFRQFCLHCFIYVGDNFCQCWNDQ